MRPSATLRRTDTGKPLAGLTITFKVGAATLCTAVTATNGTASCVAFLSRAQWMTATSYTASFAGTTSYQAAGANGALTRGFTFLGFF